MFKWLGHRSDKGTEKTKQLLDGEFNIVKEGLDEEQVVVFVENLTEQHRASQRASADTLSTLIKKAVTEAEQIAASIKMRAQTEAEDEATKIIEKARQEAEEIKKSAEAAAQKDAEDIISAADRKAELTEIETKQKIELVLLRAREDMEEAIRRDYKQAHSRLLSSLQELINQGQDIARELKDKREKLWEHKYLELKEHETTLLGASRVSESPAEIASPLESEVEPDITGKENTEEPAQLQKGVTEQVVEPQLKEEDLKKWRDIMTQLNQAGKMMKELRNKEEKLSELDKKIEETAQFEEEALEKKVEELEDKIEKPVQLEEEVLGGRIEEPVQLEKEATISEPVEAKIENPPKQHLPKERPEKEEADITQLKPEDSQALYAGEIELTIAVPAELKTVTKFYNHLQTIPDLKILYTRGSWDQGTTITVALDKPIPLLVLISKIAGIKVIPELSQKNNLPEEKSSSLRGKRKGVKRIKITLKEE